MTNTYVCCCKHNACGCMHINITVKYLVNEFPSFVTAIAMDDIKPFKILSAYIKISEEISEESRHEQRWYWPSLQNAPTAQCYSSIFQS